MNQHGFPRLDTLPNSLNNKISNESPLGAALMGAKVRQKVSYEVPAGKFTFTIKKIEKA